MKTSLNEFTKTGTKKSFVPPKPEPEKKPTTTKSTAKKQPTTTTSEPPFRRDKAAKKKNNKVSSENQQQAPKQDQSPLDISINRGANGSPNQLLTEVEAVNESTA